ncbi:MAG: ribulose-phosphate 3-epimerase [Erysipelotrichaceae bacterium]|nr:ribulose-phosphate 3-epimerase [Erysipelotrichaceae bacterium]
MIKIAPSVLSADFIDLKKQLQLVSEAKAEWIHFDVMDGHFVSNLTFGPKILSDIKKVSDLLMDVHIMVTNPDESYAWFKDADIITFHYEALDSDQKRRLLINKIKALNKMAGISIKPNTDVKVLTSLLDSVDLVLIMSVEPGFGGQSFLISALDKIKYLSQYKANNKLNYLIEVDGGINQKTALLVKAAGADVLVAGSYIFNGDIIANINSLR